MSYTCKFQNYRCLRCPLPILPASSVPCHPDLDMGVCNKHCWKALDLGACASDKMGLGLSVLRRSNPMPTKTRMQTRILCMVKSIERNLTR